MSDAQIPQDDGIQIDDVKAVRREGPSELRALLRAQIAIGRSRRDDKPKPVIPPPPGHRPGVWPTGSSPPGPPPDWRIPKPVWDAAVRHYRNEEHNPDQPCDCGNCPPEETR
ncbi:hypothetical protein AAW14_06180 [Streptomyces hygroscopicus]|uniref:hypothetical protein n=1 Tax=Streptomyces hygroscopicus TaxID=1912 RepID=UPI00223FF8AD|nr:hypothetical protein [Streptomyces hygroscopicus]MCW7941631.1 hypothetical protein [Streptomyces hygroscopicus]